jgi:tetratricopeptide (TPR) repeat protein/predicted Ser/Thr protein kinase
VDPNRWQRIRALLEAARELPEDERAAFLTEECGDDEELRREVRSLLAAGQNAGSFLGSVADTVDSDAAPLESGSDSMPDTIGRYRMLRKLGSGGMGVVYEAEQQSPQRRVAVKVVRGGRFVDEQRVRLFQREAETLARLKHPNIAAIYESGRTDDGQHFFAMELVSGQTLDAYLDTRPERITPEELRLRLDLFRELADAVHYAHQRGVIHRDLKPSNIVVTAGDPPEPKILDFGLARITEEDLAVATLTSEVGLIKGTLPYMSPEQTRADPQEIDVRADVYSLGVILYEMLSGQQPYDVMKKALGEAVRVICEEAPRPLGQSWSGVHKLDTDIETIVGMALEKEADRRYASAAAFSDDIGRFLDSQPILARPPSAAYHLRKFAQRNRTLVGGVLATSLVLVAGVVVSTLFGLREAEQRRAADRARDTLETVVDFQESMLSDVDARQMGLGMILDLRSRLAEARAARGDSPEAVERVLSQFDEWIAGVNTTDAAVRILDRNVLDRASKAIAEQFGDQPEVAARLEHTIARTYVQLGLLDEAESHVRSGLEARREALGSQDLETIASIAGLGNVLFGQGRYEEAEPLIREVFETRERVLGREHPDTLTAMNSLAAILFMYGRYEDAEPLMREIFETRERALGLEDADTLHAMSNLASVLERLNRYHEAEPVFREALEIQERVLGREHPDTLFSMNGLGALYLTVGQYDRAAILFRETLRVRRRVLGDDHPETLGTKRNLAVLYEEQGRRDDAESLFREVLDSRRRTLAADHPDLLTSQDDLARILNAKNRLIPTDRYEMRSVEGWTVYVHDDLLAEGSDVGTEALRLLTSNLDDVAQAVPESACEKLRQVPIWLGIDNGDGPTYHPSRNWLKDHGYNPDKAQSVEIGNASQFLSISANQRGILFYLLADAYHHRELGYDHEGIHAAFRAAVDRGHPGRDERSYFSKGTAAFFSSDESVRDELRRRDPELFEVLEEIW